jgi:hypothetical protein
MGEATERRGQTASVVDLKLVKYFSAPTQNSVKNKNTQK